MNKGELNDSIQEWLEDKSTELTSSIDDIIRLAEERIFNAVPDLQCFNKTQENVFYVRGGQSAPYSNPGVDFPSGMRMIKSVRVKPLDQDTVGGYLKNMTESFCRRLWPNLTDADVNPEFFYIKNNRIYICPFDVQLAAVILHVEGIGPVNLTDQDDSTTWISENAENVLLQACLTEASVFLHDPESAMIHETKMQTEMGILGVDINRSMAASSGVL